MKGAAMSGLIFLCLTLTLVTREVTGHGRLIEPPSRASMWRYGFNTPHNYNDHELYCGGYSRQWQKNGGKCGVCGDAWDMPTPRPHEQGGTYGQGVIARRYNPSSNITVRIELTANHRGYFEFRICPRETPKGKEVTQDCLDKNILMRSDGKGARFYPGDLGNKVMEMKYKLPNELECFQCVFQWRYIAGNNWGDCGNGTGAVGCGSQEEFRACADVAIGKGLPPTEISTTSQPTTTDETNEVYNTIEPNTADDTSSSSSWWLILIVVCVTLLCVSTSLVLLYWYYYHARDNVKNFLIARGLRKSPNNTKSSPKQEAPAPPQNPPPVPPRRIKKSPSFNEENEGNLV